MPSLLKPFRKSRGTSAEPEDAEPGVGSHDFAVVDAHPSHTGADAPVASDTPAGNTGRASVIVDAREVGHGPQQPIGSAAQNVDEPSVLLDRTGLPVSGLPQGTTAIDTVVTSGAKGLGPEGTATLRSLEAEAGAVGVAGKDLEANAVVAPAKGIAPEALLRGTSYTDVKKPNILAKTLSKTDGHKNDDPASPSSGTSTMLAGVSQIMPANVLGVNLSSLGLPPKATQDAVGEAKQEAGEEGPDPRETLPTKFLAGAPPAGRGEEPGVPEPDHNKMPEGLINIEKASDDENEKFHKLFPDIPPQDHLIEDYACALQRQILVQGRLYLSQHHLSFRANIIGIETILIVPHSEIVTIEKRMTALVIPNGIEIATLHARHSFASLLKRDDAFDRIVEVWRHTHPESSVPPVDKRRASIVAAHAEDTSDRPWVRAATETASLRSAESMTGPGTTGAARRVNTEPIGGSAASMVSVETTDTQGHKVHKRKKLRKLLASKLGGGTHEHGEADGAQDGGDDDDEAGGEGHAPTECKCGGDDGHFKETAMDVKFPATPEKIFNLLWSSGFMVSFLTGDQKLTELQQGDWKPNLEENGSSREMSYVKPLNASMGPKSTKCLITDTNTHVDFDQYCSTLTITRTPDVPAGSSFETRTRTCITHAGGGRCRVHVTTEVHWNSVQRFLKGIIEKSALEGQVAYHRGLNTEVRSYIKAHRSEFGGGGGDEDEDDGGETETAAEAASSSQGYLASIGLDFGRPSALFLLLGLVVLLLFTNGMTFRALRRARAGGIVGDVQQITKLLDEAEARMDTLKGRAARLASAV